MAAPGELPTLPAPPVPDRIPLPPPAVAPAEAPPLPRRSLLDYGLAALVLGLSFLVASTVARNSDLWLHLAAGRALVHGQYHFGTDPFAQGTAGVYWANTNWLYDLLTYAVFQAGGGLALVLLKAIVATLLAAVLLRLGWCGRGLWAPAVGAAWAVLVLSPWLMLHPMIVSYLFLALTLVILERPHRPAVDDAKPVTFAAYWPLLPLFALWVNLDSWFLLGPLTVALYVVGQALQTRFGPDRDGRAIRRGETAALGLALPACLLACLVSPHHFHAFLAPPAQLGLSPAARVLEHDAAFHGLAVSPFQAAYLRPGLGWNAAGLAYYPLALLGALSFALNYAGWRWRRAAVWLALFLLSALQMRAVPFFAVAAGPMLALNVQEFFSRHCAEWMRGDEARRWAVAGRLTSLLAGFVLLAAAWPGWLHAAPYEPPRWAVEVDPSLAGTAAQIDRWRRDQRLGPDDHGFNVSADAADVFAWLCPDEKGVFDARHPLFPASAAADLVTVRKALSAADEPTAPEEAQEEFFKESLAPEDGADLSHAGGAAMDRLRAVLRRRGADHLILHDNEPKTVLAWTERLLHYPAEWPLLSLDGRTAVFGWRDPEAAGAHAAFADLALDLNRLAFQPPEDRKAPATGPGREPNPPDAGEAFYKPRLPRSPWTDEAALYLVHFDEQSPRHQFRTETAWAEAVFAGAVGTAACANGSVVAPYEMTLRLNVLTARPAVGSKAKPTPIEELAYRFPTDYLARQDQGPTAPLYLALRAVRRAVHDNPDDAQAYLLLGEAYRRLLQNTRERAWFPPGAYPGVPFDEIPLLYRVRTAQAAAAYKHALVLDPDLEPAHMGFIALYQDLNYQDELLDQLKEVLRCHEAAGRGPGETAAQSQARLLDLRKLVDGKAKDVNDRLDKFEVKSAGLPAFQKADMALRAYGLAGKALFILMASDVSVFGQDGMALELELLLHVGRTGEARSWPDAVKARDFLGARRYEIVQIQQAAASGDYRQADDDIGELTEMVNRLAAPGGEALPVRAAMSLAAVQAFLAASPWDGYQPCLFRTSFFFPAILRQTDQMTNRIAQQAELLTLRGLLALESGEVGQAKRFFGDALAIWGGADAVRAGAGLDFPSRALAEDGMQTLTRAEAGR